jgi:hypothetical protein
LPDFSNDCQSICESSPGFDNTRRFLLMAYGENINGLNLKLN